MCLTFVIYVICRMELLRTVVELVIDLEQWITVVEGNLSHQHGFTKQPQDLHQQLQQLKVRKTITDWQATCLCFDEFWLN